MFLPSHIDLSLWVINFSNDMFYGEVICQRNKVSFKFIPNVKKTLYGRSFLKIYVWLNSWLAL